MFGNRWDEAQLIRGMPPVPADGNLNIKNVCHLFPTPTKASSISSSSVMQGVLEWGDGSTTSGEGTGDSRICTETDGEGGC